MSRCLVIMAICKALLLILSDAKVVHVGQKDNPQATEHQLNNGKTRVNTGVLRDFCL